MYEYFCLTVHASKKGTTPFVTYRVSLRYCACVGIIFVQTPRTSFYHSFSPTNKLFESSHIKCDRSANRWTHPPSLVEPTHQRNVKTQNGGVLHVARIIFPISPFSRTHSTSTPAGASFKTAAPTRVFFFAIFPICRLSLFVFSRFAFFHHIPS